jgi:hypothetical protein
VFQSGILNSRYLTVFQSGILNSRSPDDADDERRSVIVLPSGSAVLYYVVDGLLVLQPGSSNCQSQIHLYQFCCYLHVSVIVKAHHQAIKRYAKKDNLNTTNYNVFINCLLMAFQKS